MNTDEDRNLLEGIAGWAQASPVTASELSYLEAISSYLLDYPEKRTVLMPAASDQEQYYFSKRGFRVYSDAALELSPAVDVFILKCGLSDEPLESLLQRIKRSLNRGGLVFLCGSRPKGLQGAAVNQGLTFLAGLKERNVWILGNFGTIDIIIPIYNAADHVIPCIESVRKHTADVPYRLILINDGSTETEIGAYCKKILGKDDIYVFHRRNVGYLKSANEGIRASKENDVLLLNTDTIVTRKWLAHLLKAAWHNEKIAGANPLTNNATIYSLQQFSSCRSLAAIEKIGGIISSDFRPPLLRIPSAVGFCLFLKRKVLRELGSFDKAFGRGYGEEDDFCMRARKKEYSFALVGNAYVYHAGHVSMTRSGELLDGEEHPAESARILHERYPHFTSMIEKFVQEGTLESFKKGILTRVGSRLAGGRKKILFFLHSPINGEVAGGTEFHVRDLVDSLKATFACYVCYPCRETFQVEEYIDDLFMTYEFRKPESPSPWNMSQPLYYEKALEILQLFDINIVHIHHTKNATLDIIRAAKSLGLRILYSLHDTYLVYPDLTLSFRYRSGRYDGAAEPSRSFLKKNFAFTRPLSEWRASIRPFLGQVDLFICPSQSARREFLRAYPENMERCLVMEWGCGKNEEAEKAVREELPREPFSVCFLGGSHQSAKGFALISRLAPRLLKKGITLHFLGTNPSFWDHLPKSGKVVHHGFYDRKILQQKLTAIRPHVVILPSLAPETYGYCLSEAWIAGIPVIVSPVGALAERVSREGGGIVLADMSVKTMESEILRLAKDAELYQALNKAAALVKVKTVETSGEEHKALYERFLSGQAKDKQSKETEDIKRHIILTRVSYKPPSFPVRTKLSQRAYHQMMKIREKVIRRIGMEKYGKIRDFFLAPLTPWPALRAKITKY